MMEVNFHKNNRPLLLRISIRPSKPIYEAESIKNRSLGRIEKGVDPIINFAELIKPTPFQSYPSNSNSISDSPISQFCSPLMRYHFEPDDEPVSPGVDGVNDKLGKNSEASGTLKSES